MIKLRSIYFLRVARESRSTVSASGPEILTDCTLTHCSSSIAFALGPVYSEFLCAVQPRWSKIVMNCVDVAESELID